MTDTPALKAQTRDRVGSRYARRLRAAGQLPAVIYGHGIAPAHVALNLREFVSMLRDGHRIFSIDLDGAIQTCLVKQLQFDHLGADVVHIDLTRIDLTERVTVHVTLEFTGQPIGLKTEGAILRTVEDNLTVSCLASDIPSSAVKVDISALDVDGFLTAGQIPLPDTLTLEDEPDTTICRIVMVQELEEEVPAEAESTEPEIIGEKTDEQEGDETSGKEES